MPKMHFDDRPLLIDFGRSGSASQLIASLMLTSDRPRRVSVIRAISHDRLRAMRAFKIKGT